MGFMFEMFLTVTAAVACVNVGKAVCSRAGKTSKILVNKIFDRIDRVIQSPKKKGSE